MGRSDSTFRGVAGAAGGITSGLVTCPLDVIKTKLQAQGGFRPTNKTTHVVYRGLIGTGRVIWQEEGLRGMYRGLGPIILGYLPTWAVWFTVYGRSKEYFKGHFGKLKMQAYEEESANDQHRARNSCQFLVVNSSWGFLDYGHKPDMGDKNSIDVTSEQEIDSSK